jgi:type VI secretion system protein ImpL
MKVNFLKLLRRQERSIQKAFRRLRYFLQGRVGLRLPFFRRACLYELPWYLVLGPAGVGKSSWLRQLQLSLILSDAQRLAMRNEAFDSFVTEQALFFEVAAALFEQKTEQARRFWLVLLRCLKRARQRRPLNGVILMFRLPDLFEAQAGLQQEILTNFRLRLHELQQYLGMKIPLYIVVTHLDVVPGFADFVGRFTAAERAEVLGLTLSTGSAKQVLEQFSCQYELLIKALYHRWQRELDGEAVAQVYSRAAYFVIQMALLKKQLLEFARGIFLERNLLVMHEWRGIYFVVSQFNNAQCFDVFTEQRSLNLLPPPQGLKDKAFFVGQLCTEVFLPEREYVGMHPYFKWCAGLWAHGRILMMSAVVIVVMFTWALSAYQYLQFNARVAQVLTQPLWHAPHFSDAALNTAYVNIYPWSVLVHETQVSSFMHLGLWVYPSVSGAVQKIYEYRLVQEFLPYVFMSLTDALTQSVQHYSDRLDAIENLYDYLSSYLMFAQVHQLDSVAVVRSLDHYWQQHFTQQFELLAWLHENLSMLLKIPVPPQALDTSLTARAQVILQQTPIYFQAYVRFKLMALAEASQRLSILDDANAAEVFTDLSVLTVPFLYTQEGYRKLYRAQALGYLQAALNASWIFGAGPHIDYSKNDLAALQQHMEILYWQDFLAAWDDVLARLDLVTFRDLAQESHVLTILTMSHSPLQQLLIVLAQQVHFAGSISEDVVVQHFSPLTHLLVADSGQKTALQNIQDALVALQQYLDTLAHSSNSELSAYDAAVQIFQGQAAAPLTNLEAMAQNLPQPMSRWLMNIVMRTYGIIFAMAQSYLDRQWHTEVFAFYQQAFVGRYPFFVSPQEATLEDFDNFFKPEGIEDRFVKKYLLPFMSFDAHGHMVWMSVAQVPWSNNVALLAELNQAQHIRMAFFNDHEGGVSFTLAPQQVEDLHEFILSYDGRQVLAKHGGGSAQDFVWPATALDGEVALTYAPLLFANFTERYVGAWALFRALEHATVLPSNYANKYVVLFHHDRAQARFVLSAASVFNPFDVHLLRGYRCPEHF